MFFARIDQPLNSTDNFFRSGRVRNSIHNITFKQKEKAKKKKFELKSRKERIVTKNLKKKKL